MDKFPNLTDEQMTALAQRIAAMAGMPTDAPAPGVRQYVGARYVPLFAEPLEWSDTREYESLTIVTYQGDSYTSRQPVPTGIDIANTEFWALSGNFNAQVEAYRKEVAQLAEQVGTWSEKIDANTSAIAAEVTARENAIDNEKQAREAMDNALEAAINELKLSGSIICIGDSYGAGWTPDENYAGWPQVLDNLFPTITFYKKSTGGSGFVGGDNQFKTDLETVVANLTQNEKEKVSLVIFGGGFNDRNAQSSNILQGMQECKTYIDENLPHAKVMVSFFGCCVTNLASGGHEGATKTQCLTGMVNWYKSAGSMGWGVTKDSVWWLYDKNLFSSDYVHPNQLGLNMIAQKLASYICGTGPAAIWGEYTLSYALEASTNSPFSSTGNLIVFITVDENNKPIYIAGPTNFYGSTTHPLTSPSMKTMNNSLVLEVGKFDIPVMQGLRWMTTGKIQVNSQVSEGVNNQYYLIAPRIILSETGVLQLQNLGIINDKHDNYLSTWLLSVNIFSFKLV